MKHNPLGPDKRFRYHGKNHWGQWMYTCLACGRVYKDDGVRKHWVLMHLGKEGDPLSEEA